MLQSSCFMVVVTFQRVHIPIDLERGSGRQAPAGST